MDFVGMRQDKIVLAIDVQEAASLLGVLLEVTSQWDLLDTASVAFIAVSRRRVKACALSTYKGPELSVLCSSFGGYGTVHQSTGSG